MKNILIFYASYGGGHYSAANSIKNYFDENYSYKYNIFMVDCMEYVNHYLNYITTKAYTDLAKNVPWAWGHVYYKSQKGALAQISSTSNKVLSKKLDSLLQAFKPDLIISTHPFSSQMCAYLKQKNKINSAIATVMTDYAPHDQWLVGSEYVDYYFVAHSGMKLELENKNISSEKIFATGIPLSNRFLLTYDKDKTYNEFGLKKDKKTILFFAGGEYGLGKKSTYEMFESFVSNLADIQIIAISGKNEEIKKRFEEIVDKYNKQENVKVLGFTNCVPELMNISDLVITKPGGLTTTESLASGLPIIIINPLPGQEEENAKFLEANNVAIWIKKNDNAYEVINNLLNIPEKITQMKKNCIALSKKDSTKHICNILSSRL